MGALIDRRHLGYSLRAGTWVHLGRRARWRLASGSERPALAPSWPIPPDIRERLRVRWPARYCWAHIGALADRIKTGIAAHVPVELVEIDQPLGNVVLLEVAGLGGTGRVLIDCDDRSLLHEDGTHVDLCFKLQYSREGYGSPHVVAGGYVCPQPALYRYRSNWRALRECRPPDIDVYGRFGAAPEKQDVRARALALLGAQDRFPFRGGAVAVWWGEYMDEMCRARVCVDLPGRGELCYRLIEYLAVGACVIGPELENQLPVPLESGVHLVRTPRNLDELLDACERLLAEPERRAAIGRSAGEYFDRHLALEQLGAYYVDIMRRTLEG